MAAEDQNNEHKKRWEHFIALDSDEMRAIRSQERDFHHRRSLNAGDAFVKGSTAFRHKAAEFSVDYAKFFINANLIINAGAILALLTFLGSIFSRGSITTIILASYISGSLQTAFIYFATGLILIVVCAAISYLNWILVASSWMMEGELMIWQSGLPADPKSQPRDLDPYITLTLVLAILLGVGSTICFAAGCYSVLMAFSTLDFLSSLRR
jgi:hypothetical protein